MMKGFVFVLTLPQTIEKLAKTTCVKYVPIVCMYQRARDENARAKKTYVNITQVPIVITSFEGIST